MFVTYWLKRAKRKPFSLSRVRHPRSRPQRGLRLEALEDRTLLTVTLLNHYTGLNFSQSGGYVPPDSQGAAGTTNYVETVNQTLAIYTPKTTGASSVTDSFPDFWYTQGKLPKTDFGSFLSDPIVVWDDQVQRFIVGDQDVDSNTHVSNFDLAVSKSAAPATLTSADWSFYHISTTEGGYDADFPGNFGYNHDAFVFTLNMFGSVTGHVLVTSIKVSDLVAGNPITPFQNDLQDFSVRPTVMHDSVAGDPMWLVTEHGDGLSIDVYKMTPVLSSSATFTRTNLAVNPYSPVVSPLQPDGTAVTTNIDSRILKAAEYNNTVVATHAVSVSGTEDDARWYAINVSSGTPTLKDQGNVSAGNNNYLYYPGIDINSTGAIGMTYMQSGTGTGQFVSVYMTGRSPTDAAGTMETPVLVQAGVKNYSDFANPRRAGDLSGINVDSDGTFWSTNEWADNETGGANWGTAIGHISIGTTSSSDHFSVTASPTSTTAGTALSVTVTALDSNNNIDPKYLGTVHFTSSDSQAVLPADYTFTSTDAGVHTFTNGVTLKTAGSQTVTATDTVTSSITGSATITVNPAAASTLSVTGFPSPINAGTSGNFTVTAKDAYSNTATGYAGTVHFTSSDAQAVLPADSTLTNGTGTFSATLKTAGSQSITATDTVTSTIAGTESGITVNPLAASTLLVAGFPSPTTAGVAGNFTVTAKDIYGNTATGYRGSVKFSSSDTKAALPANYTFTSTDSGMHTFSATLKTAATQSLTATDTVTATIKGTQSGITVNPAAASTLSVTGFPSPIVAGTAGTFTVTARDAFGNVATGYLGTVHFTSTDSKAVLPANYTFVAADSGVHSFTATLKTAGTRSIQVADTVKSTIKGIQSGIIVNAAATSIFGVSGFPTQPVAGTAGTFTVTAQDAFGNKTSGYLGTVHFTSTDAQAVLPANYTFTAADAGAHTFTNGATLKTAGSQSIIATDTVTSSITGKQTVNVQPAAAQTLLVAGFPSPTTAGVAHNLTVTAKDAYGNTATGYRGTVTFSSSDPKAVLPTNYAFVAGDHGSHSFSVTLKTAGTQSLTATDTVTSSITGTQSGIVVNPAAASVLLVTGFPSPIAHGTPGSFTVTAEDAYGNIATSYRGTVHFTSSDAAASLPANYTFTSADGGTHTFSATLNTPGTQSVTAKDTVTPTITGTQSGILVTAASVEALFRDWSPGSEVEDFRQLLEYPDVAEEVAVALIGSLHSSPAIADGGQERAETQSALGAAVALLGLYWRDASARKAYGVKCTETSKSTLS